MACRAEDRQKSERLCRYGFGCLPVVERGDGDGDGDADPEPRVVGLVTETDLLRVAYPHTPRAEAAS